MRGLMQAEQLTLTRVLERAARLHSSGGILTAARHGEHEQTYGQLADRAARLSAGLVELGVRPGDRVASFAWNSWRHLELYFAVPCMGAILHTLNIRLHPEQVAWIANHAEDVVVCIDDSLLDVFAPVVSQLDSVRRFVVMGDRGQADWITDRYEDIVARSAPQAFLDLEEDQACTLCYTTGTTGTPKGVLYSHRSMVLHALMLNQASVYGLTDRDVVLPIAPMFHANAWGLPYAATLAGAKLLFTGELSADPSVIVELIERERVTLAAAVPTVWSVVLAHLEDHPADLSSLRAIVAGGSAVAASLIEAFDKRHGVPLIQGWGMTETGPLGTLARLPRELETLTDRERYAALAKQGRPVPGMRLRVVDTATGDEVPWDGTTVGELQARGPWVAAGYYREAAEESFDDGWLRTGDVASVDAFGSIRVVDRTKDMIKSGGEWISSLELEAALMSHPDVVEAAVVAVPDERWSERPAAWVTVSHDGAVTTDALLDHLRSRFPRWWLPDEIRFVSKIPKTSVGKFDKRAIRATYATPSTGG